MIGKNLKRLRLLYQFTQEDVAEKIDVSRQAVAKWESEETSPDLGSLVSLAKLYNVTVDNLINHSEESSGLIVPPKGKHFFGSVTVGERGQIVIPKKARELFDIKVGDQLLILGDEERGLGIVHQRDIINFVGCLGVVSDEKE